MSEHLACYALQEHEADLRRRLGGGVTESQFAVVSIPKGPDHHPIGRHHQRVVQTARHLEGSRNLIT